MNWIRVLGLHYETTRALYPEDKLMIVFDIDGTIIDMRCMILHALKTFDRKNKTKYFHNLKLNDINVDENTVGRLLADLKIPLPVRKSFLKWYAKYKTSPGSILESHKPFKGVMDIIQWFYRRSNVCIGLNTGRPAAIRETTLDLLNNIGQEYNVHFDDELLFMNPYDWNTDCVDIKADGIKMFRDKGFRVFAFIDNEPENLRSVEKVNTNKEILLLHANTIYKSNKDMLPIKAISGSSYDVNDLI